MKSPRFHPTDVWLLASLLVPIAVCAAVPYKIPFQGRVLAAGIPFQGTGEFKFALVSADGSQTYWRNSVDVAPADGVPDTAVSLPVVLGLYSVLLGDTSVPNMAGNLSPSTVSSGEVRLRVWFHDGVRGFQLLAPDQPLASVPYALTAASLVDSPVFTGNVGIGINAPTAPLDVAGRINATSITLGGYRALDTTGSGNLYVGNAGNPSTTALNTTGLGWSALGLLSGGNNNTAVGSYALYATTTGGLNTAVGVASLFENGNGVGNTAVGHDALRGNTTGARNIALGLDAGRNLTTGSDNIAIGNAGVAGESSTIRIGTPGTHHTTHLAGTVKADRFEGDGSGLTQVRGTMQTTSTVVAWGDNSDGETTVPPGLNGIAAIAAGSAHSVALKQDGTVVAWGWNFFGQTTVPPGLSGVTAIAAGSAHTVALKEDGTVVAWGDNSNGQTTVPPGLSSVSAIAAGLAHTVTLKQDGTVMAWGWNNHDQTTVPSGLSGVSAIAAGRYHTVALKQDGSVVAWGWNDYGQTTVSPGLSGVSAIAAGFAHTVALKQDGSVVAWGWNDYGQTTVPPGLSGVSAIAAGFAHTVALKQDGSVVVWGWNDYGQTTVPPDLSGVSAIAAGEDHTVAIRPSPRIPGDLYVSGNVSAQALLTTSDRATKHQITPVDPEAVLAKVAQLPLSEWSFQSAPATRHLGPMAQDFRAAFGLGPDDRHIATVDADGVALAAIQGLHREVRGLRDALKSKSQEIEELRHLLNEVRARLDRGE